MPLRYRHTLTMTLLALAVTAILPGCANGRIGPADHITIDSEPRGARVLVADKPIGVTPLRIMLDDVFPLHWTARTKKDDEGFAFYRRLDTLTLKQEGCETYTAQVDSQDLARDIKINLKCDPNYQPPVAAAPPSTPPSTAPVAPVQADSLEQRLQRLESLKQKGLISDEEYRTQRQRVLGEI